MKIALHALPLKSLVQLGLNHYLLVEYDGGLEEMYYMKFLLNMVLARMVIYLLI